MSQKQKGNVPKRKNWTGRKAKQKNFSGNRKRNNRGTGDGNLVLIDLPPMRSRLAVFPDRLRVHLIYSDQIQVRNNVGVKYVSWRYRSSAYDPDPALGTGAIPGFDDFSNFYGNYRVHRMKLDWDVVNAETFAVAVKVVPTPTDPGANTANISDFADANPRGYSKLLAGSSAQNRARMNSPWYEVIKIEGSIGAQFDPNFSAAVNSNPANVMYIGLTTAAVAVHAGGITTTVKVHYDLEFFNRIYQVA